MPAGTLLLPVHTGPVLQEFCAGKNCWRACLDDHVEAPILVVPKLADTFPPPFHVVLDVEREGPSH